MRKRLAKSILSMALLLASGVPAIAKESRQINLRHDVVLSGTSLPAGQYVVSWAEHTPQATVQFTRSRKVVLSAEGRFENRDKKYPADTVVYGTASDGSLTVSEIRFGGSSEVLVFKP